MKIKLNILERLLKIEDKNIPKIFFTVLFVIIFGLMLIGALNYAHMRDNKRLRGEIYTLIKINDAVIYYNRTALRLPGKLYENPFKRSGDAIYEMTADFHIAYGDIYFPSLERSVFFRSCGSGKYSVCAGLSREAIRVTPLNVNVWPPAGMSDTSAFPPRFACYVETYLDGGVDKETGKIDSNAYYTGRGFFTSSERYAFTGRCEKLSAKPDEKGRYDYLFRLGEL